MLKKASKKNANKKDLNFFNLSQKKQREIFEKAARLSTKDQQKLLREYDKKFGELQTNTYK
ncbi:hypothetical protein EOM75_15510 [Candidatus Falkowbacteria bacterium]|nr:hypothetical protein [Candidatus Falkowbacteria bacterium]